MSTPRISPKLRRSLNSIFQSMTTFRPKKLERQIDRPKTPTATCIKSDEMVRTTERIDFLKLSITKMYRQLYRTVF
jgi:hypothetical protein